MEKAAPVALQECVTKRPENSIATNSLARGYYSAVKFYFVGIYRRHLAKPARSVNSTYASVVI